VEPSEVQRAVEAGRSAASALGLLRTREGLLFADFETCCRGPVEFDIAHGLLPDEDGRMLPAAGVCEHYPGARQDLIDQCRLLIWAMVTTWRWQRDDQLPSGRYWRIEGLNQIRAAASSWPPAPGPTGTACVYNGPRNPWQADLYASIPRRK
jgi:hypothetical protein